jgi:hypothetical protein
MKFHHATRLVTTCLFVIFMLALSGRSFATCSNLGLSTPGPFHWGASGGSFPITITAGLGPINGVTPPDICSWSASYPFFTHGPLGEPFMTGSPGQNNTTNGTITIDPNPDLAPRSGNIVFTGQDNSQNPQIIPITQDASPGNFSLSASSSFTTITKGFTVSYTVTIHRAGGFIGTVCLSASNLPPGTTPSFSATCTRGTSSTPDTSSVMTLTTSGSTPVGTFTPTVTGVNTNVSQSTSAPSFTVNDFTISLNPSSLTVVQGSSNSGQVIINSFNGFSGCVALSPSNVPDGVGINFNPNPACGSSSTMTVNANGFGPLGTFQVQIDGFNQNQRRDPILTLTVAGFTLSASPATATVPPGGNTSYQVTVNPSGGYSGSVCLSVSGVPSGVTASFSPACTTGSSTMNITNNGAAASTYTLTIKGIDANQVSKTTTVTLLVGPLSVASRYVPVTPCRVADTRNPNGPFGGPFLAGNTTRGFDIPNSGCGIPSTALAYALNVTVVPKGPLGYLTMLPCGQTQPATSNLNSIDGRFKAVAAIVPAGTNGGVCAFASNDTELILDISGYFVPASSPGALAFFPVTPCRIADTRTPNGPFGGPSLTGGVTRTFPILSSNCNVPAAAQAYSLNFTAVPQGGLGFLTAWPAGQPQPLASTLNGATGTAVANAAITAAGTNGDVSVFASNDTDLVIDIDGYFAPPPGGLSLYALTPCRVLDTRNTPGSAPELDPQGPAGSSPFTGTLTVNITANGCGAPPVAPAPANAYVLNATVIPSGPLGFLTLWPDGTVQPLASTLNAADGAVTSNMAIVSTNNGSIKVFTSNPTHLVLDIFGYFAP